MANINLSQGGGAAVRKTKYFDTGLLIAVILLILTGAVFGGLRFYIYSLNNRIDELNTLIVEKQSQLTGEKVDRVADFDSRLSYLREHEPKEEISRLLPELERAMLPAAIATHFEHNKEEGTVKLDASVDSFKTLAQQIQTFASTGTFSTIRVGEGSTTETGRLKFQLTAEVVGADKK